MGFLISKHLSKGTARFIVQFLKNYRYTLEDLMLANIMKHEKLSEYYHYEYALKGKKNGKLVVKKTNSDPGARAIADFTAFDHFYLLDDQAAKDILDAFEEISFAWLRDIEDKVIEAKYGIKGIFSYENSLSVNANLSESQIININKGNSGFLRDRMLFAWEAHQTSKRTA